MICRMMDCLSRGVSLEGRPQEWFSLSLSTSLLCRLLSGISSKKLRRLFVSVAIPRITYAADMWYTPVAPAAWNPHIHTSSVGIANKFSSIQRQAVVTISGALRSTATDLLEMYTNLLPMPFLLNKACIRAAIGMSSLPPFPPLSKPVAKVAKHYVKHHRSSPPLHAGVPLIHREDRAHSTLSQLLPSYQNSHRCIPRACN